VSEFVDTVTTTSLAKVNSKTTAHRKTNAFCRESHYICSKWGLYWAT